MSTPTPGRRVAQRQRRTASRPGRGAIAGLVAVVLAGVLLAATGVVEAEPETVGRPETVPVDQVTTGCLGSPGKADSRATTVAVPLPEATEPEQQDVKSTLTAGPPGRQGSPVSGASRGVLASLDAAGPGAALAVAASGDAAVGRSTFQVDRGEAGTGVQECLAPRARWWFTGGGAGLDHQSRLVMANLDPGPAVVDVVVQGPDGPAEDVGTRGITLAPGEVRTIDLVEVAPQSDELAVHVEATRGRVVAGLSDGFATEEGATPGTEWVPAQLEASRRVRLSGLPGRADARTLVVSNPSDRDALVEVKVSGGSGAFAPTGAEQLQVPARSVATADLGDAIGKDVGGVFLRSQVPVTATVRSSLDDDVSYATAAPALEGPGAALLGERGTAEVQLSAGEAGGTAKVVAYSEKGQEVDSTVLKVVATGTSAWSPKGKAAYVVVTPVRGTVSGAVSLVDGAGVSQVALRGLPVVLTRPAVVPVVG